MTSTYTVIRRQLFVICCVGMTLCYISALCVSKCCLLNELSTIIDIFTTILIIVSLVNREGPRGSAQVVKVPGSTSLPNSTSKKNRPMSDYAANRLAILI